MQAQYSANEGERTAAIHRGWLASYLLRRSAVIVPRFLHFYRRVQQRLRAWSRTERRVLWRHTAKVASALTGVALLLALSRAPARAANIIVADGEVGINNNNVCSLIEAIVNANDGAQTHDDCVGGDPGADTITLPASGQFTLTDSYNVYYSSNTGLPLISSDITLSGNGSTIKRDTADPDHFRLLALTASGNLTLNSVTLSGGRSGHHGGGIYNNGGTLTINNSVLSGNEPLGVRNGGGLYTLDGMVTINNSIFTDNYAVNGGAISHNSGVLEINDSAFSDNAVEEHGGAIKNYEGTLLISNSTFSSNRGLYGGAINNQPGTLTMISNSTFSGNIVSDTGSAIYSYGEMTISNSTFSGNTGSSSGAIYNGYKLTISNSTLTGNTSGKGGAIFSADELTISRSLVSGNSATDGNGDEISVYGTINADDQNLFGHDGLSTADAIYGFVPDASDITATSDGTNPTALAAILDVTLADNGGPTETHALVNNSPAIDAASNAACRVGTPADGLDQRGFARNADGDGNGNLAGTECDIGAFEYDSAPPGSATIYVTAARPGTTSDGVNFSKEDILYWNGSGWSLFFDGSAEGLTNKHDVNAIQVNAADDLYLSFFPNKVSLPGLGKVRGNDVVGFDGDQFSLYFDGSDVGLTTTSEKIDGLQILAGSVAPIGDSCQAYLLISTLGTGKVPAFGGGVLKFNGEDVLGFCATNTGTATAGFWTMVLDGSEEGMRKNSTTSLSTDVALQHLYITTQDNFDVDSASGGPSMVYVFDTDSGEFSGPVFSAPDNGLSQKVDGLHISGDLP